MYISVITWIVCIYTSIILFLHTHTILYYTILSLYTKLHHIYYTLLPYPLGGELFDRIVKKTSYTEKEARELIRILFNALKYIHDKKIAHRYYLLIITIIIMIIIIYNIYVYIIYNIVIIVYRDLKPENLLLATKTDDSDVKVAG